MPVVNYVWDVVSDNVLMETDDEGNTLARYVQEPELYGEAISQERDGQVRYYDYDGLGNTSELTDENQNVTDTYEYSAFGEEIARTGTTENPFRYKGALGYYTNAETDDVYVRERMYRPAEGRWLSHDSLLFIDGVNLYLYVGNRPLNDFDPSGNVKINPVNWRLSGATCGDRKDGEACIKWRFLTDRLGKGGWPCGKSEAGYFVTRIDYYCRALKCSDVDTANPCPVKKPDKPALTFFEAERVPTPYGNIQKRVYDIASAVCEEDTCGIVKHDGVVKFFCESQTGDLTKSWSGETEFKVANCPSITGGPLAWGPIGDGQKTEPSWWAKPKTMEKVATRWFGLLWDCCNACPQTCYADADPKSSMAEDKPGTKKDSLSACE